MTEKIGLTEFDIAMLAIGQHRQRQDSLTDQLRDLIRVANRLGMYDAADFLGTAPVPERRTRG